MRHFTTTPATAQHLFVIEWESGRGTRYYDGTNSGCQIAENAVKYQSEEEAQSVIDTEFFDPAQFIVTKLD